jgi:hypothetical protein
MKCSDHIDINRGRLRPGFGLLRYNPVASAEGRRLLRCSGEQRDRHLIEIRNYSAYARCVVRDMLAHNWTFGAYRALAWELRKPADAKSPLLCSLCTSLQVFGARTRRRVFYWNVKSVPCNLFEPVHGKFHRCGNGSGLEGGCEHSHEAAHRPCQRASVPSTPMALAGPEEPRRTHFVGFQQARVGHVRDDLQPDFQAANRRSC